VDRLDDVLVAIDCIRDHLTRGPIADGLVFDAVRARLMEIGEAVKGLSDASTEQEPGIPWNEIARMRDFLAHRYFDATHSVVENTVRRDLAELEEAARRLRAKLVLGG
jgi:uncharacterized protein with HEPN domain